MDRKLMKKYVCLLIARTIHSKEKAFFLWGHRYPCHGLLVTSDLGFKARLDPITSMSIAYMQWILQTYLWCDTCWRLGGQDGGKTILIRILGHLHTTFLSRKNTHNLREKINWQESGFFYIEIYPWKINCYQQHLVTVVKKSLGVWFLM